MIPLLRNESQQKPLFHIIHEDDIYLLNTPDAEWFQVLYHFRCERYLEFGVKYYDALYEFNQKQAREREERGDDQEEEAVESKEEARQRLLFSRVTKQAESEIREGVLFEVKLVLVKTGIGELPSSGVFAESIASGKVSLRLGGRKPKCFFALLKSFTGATIMGFPAEPEWVYMLLKSNPSFARVCGFIPRHVRDEYCSEHIPSLRKLEQFDQVMTESGIWAKIKGEEVKENIKSGVIRKEKELVGDTTHYYAYSGFETVVYRASA